jgi:hypothetical protein
MEVGKGDAAKTELLPNVPTEYSDKECTEPARKRRVRKTPSSQGRARIFGTLQKATV